MRFVNNAGRAALDVDGGVVDLEHASDGRFDADPMEALARWDEVREFAASSAAERRADMAVDEDRLGPCVPRPAKVFGVALNYRMHAQETGAELPPVPSVFTKFPSCIVGPRHEVVLPSGFVDWEVELVAVVGRRVSRLSESSAMGAVAGYCVGQDYSERQVQMAGPRPQFSLGKSYDTFGPIGPAVVTVDAFDDPHDVALWCEVNGERVQDSRTSDLIFDVPALIGYISAICTLEPGDLVFTGTPSGVGVARRPPRFLKHGDVVVSGIERIGTLENRALDR